MKIDKNDIEKLPFGCQVSVKILNGNIENGVIIAGSIAFEDGFIVDFEDCSNMEVYLGWNMCTK